MKINEQNKPVNALTAERKGKNNIQVCINGRLKWVCNRETDQNHHRIKDSNTGSLFASKLPNGSEDNQRAQNELFEAYKTYALNKLDNIGQLEVKQLLYYIKLGKRIQARYIDQENKKLKLIKEKVANKEATKMEYNKQWIDKQHHIKQLRLTLKEIMRVAITKLSPKGLSTYKRIISLNNIQKFHIPLHFN